MRAAVAGLFLAAACVVVVAKLSSVETVAGQNPEELDQTVRDTPQNCLASCALRLPRNSSTNSPRVSLVEQWR